MTVNMRKDLDAAYRATLARWCDASEAHRRAGGGVRLTEARILHFATLRIGRWLVLELNR